MEITLTHYLILAAVVFVIGVTGLFINKKSIITILMSVELMLLAVNINFVAFSVYLHDLVGPGFYIVHSNRRRAAEAAIGLAILVAFFRNSRNHTC